MKEHATAGDTIFYDIYTEEEKAADPAKENTGLFFFKGEPGARFAVCNAGGGFAYVGAMHDSFPHALELSKKGYNAFALIYRPGAQTACEDLARAISFIFEHDTLYGLYEEQGLSDVEIDELLVLDIKEHDYFTDRNMTNEHGGGGLFAYDEEIMGWLFSK